MSHPNYNSPGRSLRPSPTGGNSHSGSLYPEQGWSSNVASTPLNSISTSLETVSNNYPYPYPTTQQRSTPVPYEQSYYSSTQQQTPAYPNYSSYQHQQPSDARYLSGQTYGPYNRASPSSSSTETRRLPPLSVPGDERFQGPQQYYLSHTELQMPPTTNDMRSPHGAYPTAQSYPQYQSLAPAGYPAGHSSSRGAVPSMAATNAHYHQPLPMGHPSLDRTAPSSRGTAQLPYARAAPLMSPVDYDLQPESPEPTIKKKRKRADARQLEVLNATYARTAFPSTEERAALAKELDMSARSVQIWFQNKRQSARQGGRNAANPVPTSVPAPVPTPTPPISGYRASPVVMSPMVESSTPTYSSRSPPPGMMRSGQTSSPPGGRPRGHWPGPSRGY